MVNVLSLRVQYLVMVVGWHRHLKSIVNNGESGIGELGGECRVDSKFSDLEEWGEELTEWQSMQRVLKGFFKKLLLR